MRLLLKRRGAGRPTARPTAPAVAESQVLLAALRGSPPPGLQQAEQALLLEAAAYHGVVTAVYRAYRRSGTATVPDGLPEMAGNRRATAMRIGRWCIEVSEWLDAAGVTHAILKGPAIAAAYPDADREFVDLDVLVAPAAMVKAIAVLELHGAQALEQTGWPRRDGIGELTLGLPSGVAIDLHAELIHRQGVRRDFRLSTESLLARATRGFVLGHAVPVLDPEDTLTHVALHAMLSGGDRLVWLADLDALVRKGGIRWPVLIERAREEKLALVIGVLLQRASTVLGTPVPATALKDLRRDGVLWSWLLAEFERRRPTAASYGRNFRGQILVRSTRASSVASMFVLARLIWTDVVLFLLRNRDHPWRTGRGQQRDMQARIG